MQTILGANGQIATELARALRHDFTDDLRLVSRNPRRVDERDQLMSADLMDAEATTAAVSGSEVAYLTVGLPMDSELWEQRFPTMMANVIAACRRHDCRLVFFDNTYMYPRTSAPQTEETPFTPVGRKSTVRARIATMLLDEMRSGELQAVICRAPEFYGPGDTKSLTNTLVFDRIAAGKRALVPVSATTRRTLIWTPDASRGMALLGNTADAYGQTWHLPCDPERLTYRELIGIAGDVLGRRVGYSTLPAWVFSVGARFNSELREASELLPRYEVDNVFDSTKFADRFGEFAVTSYRQGITEMLAG